MKLSSGSVYMSNEKHVYVMLSESSLVKIGVSQNVILRAQTLMSKPTEQKIVRIAYTESMPYQKALMYEAALIGFYRKAMIGDGEWCTAKFCTVVETLEAFTEMKTQIISIGDAAETCSNTQALLDSMMLNEGYCMKLAQNGNKKFYLKIEGDICTLTKKTIGGRKDICTLPVREMFAYVAENNMQLERKLYENHSETTKRLVSK